MLFSNPLAAGSTTELHDLHKIKENGIQRVEVQLPESRYSEEELRNLFQVTGTRPIAFRAPRHLALGKKPLPTEEWAYWMKTVAPLFAEEGKRYLICSGAPVTLGEVFEYLDARPRDFNALHDFKTQYVETVIDQLKELEVIAARHDIQLLLENAPMGGREYFEPGKGWIHPALRTPRHLLRIIEATGVKLCFDTANARITSNALSYMHRSRSLFAGATEKEIISATRTWHDFYRQVKEETALIRLSYAVSWGDTDATTHIPFPEPAHAELLDFAEQAESDVPIILPAGEEGKHLKPMLDVLHQLKKK